MVRDWVVGDVPLRHAVRSDLAAIDARNVPFYERLGFRGAAEVATPDGSAVMRPMHREVRGSSTAAE